MGLMGEILLATVCVLGLSFLGWWLFGRLLRPIPAERAGILLPGRGEGDGLEQTVRAMIWLRSLGLLNCPVVIADVDLTPAGRELALRLAARWPGIVLWPADCLDEWVKEY